MNILYKFSNMLKKAHFEDLYSTEDKPKEPWVTSDVKKQLYKEFLMHLTHIIKGEDNIDEIKNITTKEFEGNIEKLKEDEQFSLFIDHLISVYEKTGDRKLLNLLKFYKLVRKEKNTSEEDKTKFISLSKTSSYREATKNSSPSSYFDDPEELAKEEGFEDEESEWEEADEDAVVTGKKPKLDKKEIKETGKDVKKELNKDFSEKEKEDTDNEEKEEEGKPAPENVNKQYLSILFNKFNKSLSKSGDKDLITSADWNNFISTSLPKIKQQFKEQGISYLKYNKDSFIKACLGIYRSTDSVLVNLESPERNSGINIETGNKIKSFSEKKDITQYDYSTFANEVLPKYFTSWLEKNEVFKKLKLTEKNKRNKLVYPGGKHKLTEFPVVSAPDSSGEKIVQGDMVEYLGEQGPSEKVTKQEIKPENKFKLFPEKETARKSKSPHQSFDNSFIKEGEEEIKFSTPEINKRYLVSKIYATTDKIEMDVSKYMYYIIGTADGAFVKDVSSSFKKLNEARGFEYDDLYDAISLTSPQFSEIAAAKDKVFKDPYGEVIDINDLFYVPSFKAASFGGSLIKEGDNKEEDLLRDKVFPETSKNTEETQFGKTIYPFGKPENLPLPELKSAPIPSGKEKIDISGKKVVPVDMGMYDINETPKIPRPKKPKLNKYPNLFKVTQKFVRTDPFRVKEVEGSKFSPPATDWVEGINLRDGGDFPRKFPTYLIRSVGERSPIISQIEEDILLHEALFMSLLDIYKEAEIEQKPLQQAEPGDYTVESDDGNTQEVTKKPSGDYEVIDESGNKAVVSQNDPDTKSDLDQKSVATSK